MNKSLHIFDLDGTLWNINSDIWIIDKESPYKKIFKIDKLEFSKIKNGTYFKDNLILDYNGNKFFISEFMWNKISKKFKTKNINRFGISFDSFYNEDELNKVNIEFLYNNIKHLINKNDIDIGLLTARNNVKIHANILNNLRLNLKNMNLSLDKIFFVGDKFLYHHDDKSSIKKVNVLLEHLIGYKINKNKFIDTKQDWYENVYFYDDSKLNIDYANNIQENLNNLIYNTDELLIKNIIEKINNNNIKLYTNLITNNDLNKFKITEIEIKEPTEYPIEEKLFTKFNNFILNKI